MFALRTTKKTTKNQTFSCVRKNMQRNKQVAMGRKKFNMDPKKVRGSHLWKYNFPHEFLKAGRDLWLTLFFQGIQFLIENDLLKNTSDDIAQFLYKGEGLNKTAIGDYLGERFRRSPFKSLLSVYPHTYLTLSIINRQQTMWLIRASHGECILSALLRFLLAWDTPFLSQTFFISPTFWLSCHDWACCSTASICPRLSNSFIRDSDNTKPVCMCLETDWFFLFSEAHSHLSQAVVCEDQLPGSDNRLLMNALCFFTTKLRVSLICDLRGVVWSVPGFSIHDWSLVHGGQEKGGHWQWALLRVIPWSHSGRLFTLKGTKVVGDVMIKIRW